MPVLCLNFPMCALEDVNHPPSLQNINYCKARQNKKIRYFSERKDKMHDWKASLKGLHYKHSRFPQQEKSYTEPELHNKANRLQATYSHKQRS